MKIALHIDASELNAKIQTLQAIMEPGKFNNRIAGVFRRSVGGIRKINKKDVPIKYYARATEIGSVFGYPRVSVGGAGVSCTIPLRDRRKGLSLKSHGRTTFKVTQGGAPGWNIPQGGYDISAQIVKAGESTLPELMKSYGGQPPFINTSASRLNGLVFTRVGKDRWSGGRWVKAKIRAVKAMAIPQMPMNRSEPEVQRDIKKLLEKRIVHEIERELSKL